MWVEHSSLYYLSLRQVGLDRCDVMRFLLSWFADVVATWWRQKQVQKASRDSAAAAQNSATTTITRSKQTRTPCCRHQHHHQNVKTSSSLSTTTTTNSEHQNKSTKYALRFYLRLFPLFYPSYYVSSQHQSHSHHQRQRQRRYSVNKHHPFNFLLTTTLFFRLQYPKNTSVNKTKQNEKHTYNIQIPKHVYE